MLILKSRTALRSIQPSVQWTEGDFSLKVRRLKRDVRPNIDIKNTFNFTYTSPVSSSMALGNTDTNPSTTVIIVNNTTTSTTATFVPRRHHHHNSYCELNPVLVLHCSTPARKKTAVGRHLKENKAWSNQTRAELIKPTFPLYRFIVVQYVTVLFCSDEELFNYSFSVY
jgi:hypothetical protein